MSSEEDSYVITEDSYIDYLSYGDVGGLIPIALWQRHDEQQPAVPRLLAERLEPARDPQQDLGARKLVEKSWAVQREPSDPKVSKIEQTLWDKRANVELVYCELKEYVRELEARLAPPTDAQDAG